MIASLPMYDRPETAAALDRLWDIVRNELRGLKWDAPDALIHGGDPWRIWRSPDLLLSQTCGYPYRARLHGSVVILGSPDCRLPDCRPGYYNSVLVARRSDPRAAPWDFAGARLAYNEAMSQSGWAAPQTEAAALGFRFEDTVRTGSHAASARAVADGRADIAAIDAVTWAMITRWDDCAAALKEIGRTTPTPALPFITAPRPRTEDICHALTHGIATLSGADRDCLHLYGLTHVHTDRYLEVPTPPGPNSE